MTGDTDTGSIEFHYGGLTARDSNRKVDRLERFKFFGTKICDVLGLKHNDWYYPQDFRIKSGSTNYYRGNVESKNISVYNNFKIANYGSVNSDLPFKIEHDTSRYIKYKS